MNLMVAVDHTSTGLSSTITDHDRTYPTLTTQQISRLADRGQRLQTRRGEVLVCAGDTDAPVFVVISGEVQAVHPTPMGETLIATLGSGQFSGEVNMITGRHALNEIRVSNSGEVIELRREALAWLLQTDAELSEIVMGAFMHRRMALIASGSGDVVVIGSAYNQGTLHVKGFLTRNGHPFHYVDFDSDRDAQRWLDRFHVDVHDMPVVICRDRKVLRNPTNMQIADCLGFNEDLDPTRVTDLVIAGAGPAGLAAAVYGASEGLDVLVLESNLPGGQAGSSSRIEYYLGFPTGVSGNELMGRAYAQALKFGARVLIAKGATRLVCDTEWHTVDIDDGPRIRARAVIIATGAQYRRPSIDGLSAFEGSGVYYGATPTEAQLCVGEEVVVVGGGNSAGQAAMFLASTARRVHMLVRGASLADTMSRYLSRRIESTPSVVVRRRTQITGLDGKERVERVFWRDEETGVTEEHQIRHVFMMTGAVPNTDWLDGRIVLDEDRFVKTGSDLSSTELAAAKWPLARSPFLLETSLPRVFAVGDVRSRNAKRVASAVGEGSTAVAFVHQVLRK